MILDDKELLIQTIDSLDIGGAGKKVLKAILNIRDQERVTQKLISELTCSSTDSLAQVMQRLLDKNLIIQHGKYKGSIFELNDELLKLKAEKYIQKQIIINNLKTKN